MSVLSVREQAQKSEHIEMGGMPGGNSKQQQCPLPFCRLIGCPFDAMQGLCKIPLLESKAKAADGGIMRLGSGEPSVGNWRNSPYRRLTGER